MVVESASASHAVRATTDTLENVVGVMADSRIEDVDGRDSLSSAAWHSYLRSPAAVDSGRSPGTRRFVGDAEFHCPRLAVRIVAQRRDLTY